MAIHTRIEPDCPKCGAELIQYSRGLPPFDRMHLFGTTFEAWYGCKDCGFETEHATAEHRDPAQQAAKKLAEPYMPKVAPVQQEGTK